MTREREDGACYAYSKGDGTSYRLKRSEHTRLKSEWMAGRAFFEGVALYGAAITLKLGDIVAIVDAPPETLAAGIADSREDAREDALES